MSMMILNNALSFSMKHVFLLWLSTVELHHKMSKVCSIHTQILNGSHAKQSHANKHANFRQSETYFPTNGATDQSKIAPPCHVFNGFSRFSTLDLST